MNESSPIVAILGIGTAVPAYRLDQADTAKRLAEGLADHPDSARWSKRIFKQCGVDTRYTCEPNLLESADRCRYYPGRSAEDVPSTAERMAVYKRESVPLGLKAAKQALADGQVDRSDITHLITVSCTGQFLPGMDAALVRELGLSVTVNRIPLTFLGCAAGLKAVGLAQQIVADHPSGCVLIVCVELCTLHIQPSATREALFGASFFGDGASACVVGVAGEGRRGLFQLSRPYSALLPGGAEEMVWEVGNNGFDLYLSTGIPKLIGQFIAEPLAPFVAGGKPELWAIHPGGKGIIDTMEDLFGLTQEQTRACRAVLRDYGNMSSATILFVLEDMRRELASRGSGPVGGVALAFGPGLSCELVGIEYVPSVPLQAQARDEAYV
ncbi:Alpha-pyrone synthesis polyketide synthase-like Pks18 [Paenibacillus solanacearum]|uniref:Alpha-pyrone synthesis polyketide synthase-like Pks18 n=1 Tax=Paenibacillus solanacearum TaxID=2048548 RepID=A0A916K519_9BACL|nr:type III polyketide synthase [Paenibacillus solanacearum]CAG7640355.1 Alpha-pyrone synthesis polyketide synthase-like Pks18 [Paenibacillus solanacearum]